MAYTSITNSTVKFNSSLSTAEAKLSQDKGTIHFTTDGDIVLNGQEYGSTSALSDLKDLAYMDPADVTTLTNLTIAQSQVTDLATALAAKAPLASPALTGTPTAPTAALGTNTTQIATTAFVASAVNNLIAASEAMVFKGTIGDSTATIQSLPVKHQVGDTYKVAKAGTYAGNVCEIGDVLICVTSSENSNAASDWTVVQNNIDGAVTGPSSAVVDNLAAYNASTGKVIKDSGLTTASVSAAITNASNAITYLTWE